MDETTDLAHARELARRAADEERIAVAVSGDGMIGAIADELRELPGAVVGIVPGGRGNDLARVLGIPTDPLAAANVLLDGIERAVDVGLVEPAVGPARAFSGSRQPALTATLTASRMRRPPGWAAPSTRTARFARSSPGGPRGSRH